MTRVANYENFSDTSFDLKVGGDIDRTLTQDIENRPVHNEGALLTWNVRLEGSGGVSYDLTVNNALQARYTVNLADWSAVQEVLRTDAIKQGTNTIEFKVTGGTGTLSIGDVVLFYRQEV